MKPVLVMGLACVMIVLNTTYTESIVLTKIVAFV